MSHLDYGLCPGRARIFYYYSFAIKRLEVRMAESESWFLQELETRGLSRRDFMGFCSAMAAALALPRTAAARIAAEIQKTEKELDEARAARHLKLRW